MNSNEDRILCEYIENLEIFEADLELMLVHNFEIIYSIDFFDIFEYSFPFYNSRITDELNDERSVYIIQQLGRHIFFSDFENFCIKPAMLLPPHLEELNSFLEYLNRSIERFQYFVEKEEYFKTTLENLEKLKGEEDINIISNDILLKILDKEIRNIAFLLTPSFESNIKFFKNLIQKININGKGIEEYGDIYSQLNSEDFIAFRDKMDKIRPSASKQIANTRDAQAIQFVKDLNKRLKDDKKIIFFVSSAHHMQYFQLINPILYNLNGKKYHLIRSSMYFFIAMLVYINYIEQRGANNLMDHNFLDYVRDELKMLKCADERIRSAIDNSSNAKLDSYAEFESTYNKKVEARLAYSNALEADGLLEKYISKKEGLDIAFLIEKKLPMHEREYIRKLMNDSKPQINTIIEAIKSKKFLDFLRGKKLELEFEKIRNILNLIELTRSLNSEDINEIIKIIYKYQFKEIFYLNREFVRYLEDGKTSILNEKLIMKGFSKVDNPIIIFKEYPAACCGDGQETVLRKAAYSACND